MSILRRLRGHRTVIKIQGLDSYARACCTCGATFRCLQGAFMLSDVQLWEDEHPRPGADKEPRPPCPRFGSPRCWCAQDSKTDATALEPFAG